MTPGYVKRRFIGGVAHNQTIVMHGLHRTYSVPHRELPDWRSHRDFPERPPYNFDDYTLRQIQGPGGVWCHFMVYVGVTDSQLHGFLEGHFQLKESR